MSDIITHNAKPGLSTKGIPNLELILFKSRPKCLHLVGYPGLIFDQAFDFQVLIGLLYPPNDCQPLKLLGKATKLEMQMGQIKDAILQWPIFARIYARGEAGTAVAGNKLTLMLNSIEQNSAVARLSHF